MVSNKKKRPPKKCQNTTFDKNSEIGSPRQKKKYGPRLHDLRHRFAIETMLNWYRSGQEVERCLPVLSTYLGHLNVTHTYWYLTACPEFMGLAVQRLESHWKAKS